MHHTTLINNSHPSERIEVTSHVGSDFQRWLSASLPAAVCVFSPVVDVVVRPAEVF